MEGVLRDVLRFVVVGGVLGAPALVAAAPAVPVRDLPPIPVVAEETDSVADVSLTSAAQADDDRVSGAAKREQSLGSVASAVTVIGSDQLRRFGYRTVAEALAGLAGTWITDDRAIERVGIRGVQLLGDANTRILVLIDGTPLNEPWSQYVDAADGVPLDLADVARIELIRGPVSSIYGTNAFLGIVNIVTQAADVAGPARGQLFTDSFGGAGGSAGFATGGVDRQLRGSVRFRRRGGEELSYDALEGATTADGQDALTAGLTATYDQLFVQLRASQRERELPGAPFGATYGDGDNRNRDRLLVGELGYTRDLGKRVDLVGRLYASAYDFDGTLAYADDTTLATHGASRWFGGELRLQGDGRALMPAGGRLDVTTGLAFESASTAAESVRSGEEAPPPIEQELSILGAYGEATAQPVSWAALTAGVRFDRNSLFESKLNPRLALLLFAGERFGAKALYAEGFRNPSAFEAFFEDDRFKPAGTALFPETIRSIEGVLWARPRRGLKLRASAWQWDLRALIERRSVVDPMTLTERFQYQNLAALRSLGVEVEASYRDTNGWFVFAGGAWAQVRRNVIDTPPNAPELTAAGGISTPALFERVHVSMQGTYVGRRLTRDEEIEVPPWIGVDLTLFAPSIRGFDLSVGARNLIGTRAEVVAQDDYDRPSQGSLGEPPTEVLTIPGTGRELFLRLGYAL